MKTIDLSGKPCPIPVIEAKKALAKQGGQKILFKVDNSATVKNLNKMADACGYEFSFTEHGPGVFEVIIGGGEKGSVEPMNEDELPFVCCNSQAENIVVTIGSKAMGKGSEELGRILIKSFIYSLTELPIPPKYLILFNSGVFLAVEGANTIEDLKRLKEKGTEILSCGTCLDYFKLQDKLAVGTVTDMYGTTEKMVSAGKLINI